MEQQALAFAAALTQGLIVIIALTASASLAMSAYHAIQFIKGK